VIQDIVAHPAAMPGSSLAQAHSGMLRCAQALLAVHLPAMRALLTEYPG
jgi:hypothetical protein